MEEVWKPIPHYEWSYEVSNFGKVRSQNRTITNVNGVRQKWKGKIIASWGIRYQTVSLFRAGIDPKTVFIHHLVAEAFVPNPNGKPRVSFKDWNRKNCRSDNLFWATPKEIRHRVLARKS